MSSRPPLPPFTQETAVQKVRLAEEGNWFGAYGNENWEFDPHGLMYARHASINDLPIKEPERKFHWPSGRRPDDHLGGGANWGFKAAVSREVSLSIAIQVQASCHHPAGYGFFPDRGMHYLALPLDIARKTYIHRDERIHGAPSSGREYSDFHRHGVIERHDRRRCGAWLRSWSQEAT